MGAALGVADLFQDDDALAEGLATADVLDDVGAVNVALARQDVDAVVDVEDHQQQLRDASATRVDRLVGLAEDRARHRLEVQAQNSGDVDGVLDGVHGQLQRVLGEVAAEQVVQHAVGARLDDEGQAVAVAVLQEAARQRVVGVVVGHASLKAVV